MNVETKTFDLSAKAEAEFLNIIWAETARAHEPMIEVTTWSTTAVAAGFALILSNMASLVAIADIDYLKPGLLALLFSMLFGAMARSMGISLRGMIEIDAQMTARLKTSEVDALMDAMTTTPEELNKKMESPYLWPLTIYVRRGARQGMGQTGHSKQWNWTRHGTKATFCYWAHVGFTLTGFSILVLSFYIK